jgi:hypothetical protein
MARQQIENYGRIIDHRDGQSLRGSRPRIVDFNARSAVTGAPFAGPFADAKLANATRDARTSARSESEESVAGGEPFALVARYLEL